MPCSASYRTEVASGWLVDLESVEYPKELTFQRGRWEGLGGEARKLLNWQALAVRNIGGKAVTAPNVLVDHATRHLARVAGASRRVRSGVMASSSTATPSRLTS